MKIVIIVILAVVILFGGYLYLTMINRSQNNQELGQDGRVDTNSVILKNFSFIPANIKAKAGAEIVFVNQDNVDHTVTADDGQFDQAIAAGQTTTVVISEPGIYRYHCTPHPNMTGSIMIEQP